MKKSIIALALVTVSSAAFADSFIYGGASAGSSSFNGGTGSSVSIHAGTGILPFVGVEAGYTRSGDMDTASGESTEITTTYVALKPSLDVGPLQIYAKGGLHSWEEKVTTSAGTTTDDGVSVMYGVGAEYFVGGPMSVGASYQTYSIGGKEMTDFTLNATVHFL